MARKTTTDEQPAAKRAKRTTAADLLEKYKDFEGISVVSRVLNDPDGAGDDGIRLKDEPGFDVDPQGKRRIWHLRWVNTAQSGRWQSVVNRKGFIAVKLSDLANANDVAGLSKSDDGLVRRGDHGKEVLVKQPLELYTFRKREEHDRRTRRAKNAKLVKEELAQSAGQALGSEAGDTIHDEFSVEYAPQRRTTVGEELERA